MIKSAKIVLIASTLLLTCKCLIPCQQTHFFFSGWQLVWGWLQSMRCANVNVVSSYTQCYLSIFLTRFTSDRIGLDYKTKRYQKVQTWWFQINTSTKCVFEFVYLFFLLQEICSSGLHNCVIWIHSSRSLLIKRPLILPHAWDTSDRKEDSVRKVGATRVVKIVPLQRHCATRV